MTSRSQIARWQNDSYKAWSLHFLLTFSVMLAGVFHNGGKFKLIPSKLRIEGCTKTLINVLKKKEEEEDSIVCCNENQDSFSLLCAPSYPPLYKRLTRLPDAWLLPLLPIIVRGISLLWHTFFSQSTSESISTYLRRFNLYMGILSIRTFILFVGLNWLEEKLVGTYSAECWFSEYARRSKPTCRGMEFDYSDHTVLYLGQILPMFLFEMQYAAIVPILGGPLVSYFLIASLAYVYFITLLGEFQTAAYFHTGEEILVGYAISLSIQIPLAYLQCSNSWERMRNKLFGFSMMASKN
mmetsp:Transcript_24186/g.36787  ORF Transcript_24186/g.36787 Transcript_24186/m.36787 type:complete len:296 (-) Transcript_24186:1094-1981(-)